jgi:hypothetical protein
MGLAYLESAGGLFIRRGPILRGGEVGSAGADRLRVYAVKPILAALAFTLRTDAIRITVIYTRLNARFIL